MVIDGDAPQLLVGDLDVLALLVGQGTIGEVVIDQPGPGEIVVFDAMPGQQLVLNFDPTVAQVFVEGNAFVIRFPDGGEIRFPGLGGFGDAGLDMAFPTQTIYTHNVTA